jgi:hypothetical protein
LNTVSTIAMWEQFPLPLIEVAMLHHTASAGQRRSNIGCRDQNAAPDPAAACT